MVYINPTLYYWELGLRVRTADLLVFFSPDEGSAKHSGEHYPPLVVCGFKLYTRRQGGLSFYIFCIKFGSVLILYTVFFLFLRRQNLKNNLKFGLVGLAAGILNGMFGAGGGMIVVPMLEKAGINPKNSHATSIVIIAGLSFLSFFGYYFGGHIDFQNTLGYIPAGAVGVIFGSHLLKKIKTDLLRRIFGIIIIISSIRLFFK